MANKKVVITGASGMIGGLVLDHCLNSDEIANIISLVRRPSGKEHPKLTEIVVNDFLQLDELSEPLKNIDIVYYCLGVYTGAVPADEFRKITVDYPKVLADKLVENQCKTTWCLLSGQGADRSERSRMMFARDKGAIENYLSALDLSAFYSFRPGYIYPVEKRQEPNLSYRISRKLYPLLKWMGTKFSIQSTELAKGMFLVGLNGFEQQVLENKDIVALGNP